VVGLWKQTLNVIPSMCERDVSTTLEMMDGFLASCLLCHHGEVMEGTVRMLHDTLGSIPDLTLPPRLQRALGTPDFENAFERYGLPSLGTARTSVSAGPS
jgi:hypothetical protein